MEERNTFGQDVEILVEDGDTVEQDAIVAWIRGRAVWRAPFAADVIRAGQNVTLRERSGILVAIQCHVCKEWHELTVDEIEMYVNQEHAGLPWMCPECITNTYGRDQSYDGTNIYVRCASCGERHELSVEEAMPINPQDLREYAKHWLCPECQQ